jgi:DNA-binding transcriptional LysR family regulator
MEVSPTPDDILGELDVKWLRLFEQVYATRSVTRSAEALGQSQPTVSIWLGKLRERLGDVLFVRTVDGMLPTPRAQALIAPVRDALRALAEITAPQAAFDPATSTRPWRICMTDASHATVLPRLLAQLRAQAPRAPVTAVRIDGETASALQSGAADLAVGYIPGLDTGFYQQALFTQDWICLAGPTNTRIGATLTLRGYREAEHVVTAAGTGAADLEAALARARVERRVMLSLPGFLGLAAIVSASDLVATLPRTIGELLARNAGLRVLACPFPVPSFTVKQYWHGRFHQDPANRWLREQVAALLMDSPRATRVRSPRATP